jgi:hypothetical protein
MMMANGLEQQYFEWLCGKVSIEYGKVTQRTYEGLLGQLHSKEFIWTVPNDDNRQGDCKDLRDEFRYQYNIGDTLLSELPCSILEVIVSLSERLEFIDGREGPLWAWTLIENLQLHKMFDPLSTRKQAIIDDILDTFIWRNYEKDGTGGLFPLAYPAEDQTKVELWYQMAAYLEEQP